MIMTSVLSPESSTVKRTEISLASARPSQPGVFPSAALWPYLFPRWGQVHLAHQCLHLHGSGGQSCPNPPTGGESWLAWGLLQCTLWPQVPSTLKFLKSFTSPAAGNMLISLPLLQKNIFSKNLHLLIFKVLLTQMVARHRKYRWNFWYLKLVYVLPTGLSVTYIN